MALLSGLWDTTADYRHHQTLLQQLHTQSRQQRNQLWSEDWRQTRLYNVGNALQHDHWLGNEAYNRRSVTEHHGPYFSLDLDFADDLALVSHTHQHMHEKTTRLSTYAQQVSLRISQKKTGVMLLNVSNPTPVQVNGEDLPTTEEFTYLGSTVRHDGGAGNNIKNRLNKARHAFRILNNVWRSSHYSTKTKLRRSEDLPKLCDVHLLYGFECWRMTESDITKLSVFHTKNLRRILQTFWPDTISNQQLLAWCNKDSIENIIMGRRWRWIGHVMRREQDNITSTALHWTPEGKRKRWRPRNTWRRTVEAELKTMQHTWGTIQKLARNRQTWRFFVAVLRTTRHNGHEWVWWVNGRTLDLKKFWISLVQLLCLLSKPKGDIAASYLHYFY